MVPTNVNEPFELIEYVLTKLFNASVATIRPCASKVNENGTGFAATVTVALDVKDRHGVAPGIGGDQFRAVVNERESTLARQGVGGRTRGRSTRATGRIGRDVGNGAVGPAGVTDDRVAAGLIGFDEKGVGRRRTVLGRRRAGE